MEHFPDDVERPRVVERLLRRHVQEVQAPQDAIDLRRSGCRVLYLSVVAGVLEQLLEEVAGLGAPDEVSEGRVDLLDRRRLSASRGEPVSHEGAYVIVGVLLDWVPVTLVILVLPPALEAHEDENHIQRNKVHRRTFSSSF